MKSFGPSAYLKCIMREAQLAIFRVGGKQGHHLHTAEDTRDRIDIMRCG